VTGVVAPAEAFARMDAMPDDDEDQDAGGGGVV
jgi:hypothetical protein